MSCFLKDDQMLVIDRDILYSRHCTFIPLNICSDMELIT